MNTLHLAAHLDVPLNFVTEKHAWIGATGSGKTYGAQRSAEQLWHARAPFVVLDPKGDWWGLRLSADGKKPGLLIPVFGGLHGDIPLEPTGGALVADLIFDKHISAVVDVSQFDTDADRTRFVTAFLDQLYTRHKRAPTARHIYMEECQEFIPQNPQPGEQRLLHVAQRVQKMGRGVGIGTSLITQRPQEVSKKALNQAQTIFMFRLTGSQERKAMKEWVTAQGLTDELLAGLPELPTGNCHVWSPAWLKIFATVKIAHKETFDASATPEVGAKTVVRELAQIDLVGLKDAMAATVERAKAEDPKELRRELAELRRQLEARPATFLPIKEKRIEVPVLTEPQIRRLEVALEKGREVAEASVGAMLVVTKLLERFRPVPAPRQFVKAPGLPAQEVFPPKGPSEARARVIQYSVRRAPETPIHNGEVTRPQQRILDALAQLVEWNVNVPDRRQVALLAEQSPSSSGYEKNVGVLKGLGFIHYAQPGCLALTPEGQKRSQLIAGSSGQVMRDGFLTRVTRPQAAILRVLIDRYPEDVARGAVADLAGQSATSSGYEKNVGALKSLGVLTYPKHGFLRAADILFVEA